MRRFRHGVRGVLTALLVLGAVAPAGLLATRTTQAAPAPALSSAATANVAPCDQAGLRSAFAAGGTLTFAQSCALSLTAPLTTTAGMSVTLNGGGYRVTLDGGNATQLVVVPNGATVTLSRLTLAQGYADNQRGSAGGLAGAFGGAIKNAGNLTILQSTLVGNTAQGQPGDAGMAAGGGAAGIGGAIYSAGPGSAVTIVNSTLVSNTASGGAGGDHGAYSGCPSVAGAGGGYNAGSAGGCFYAGGNGGFGGGGGGSNDTSGGPPAGNGGFGGGGGGTAYNGGGTGGVGGGQGGAWGGGGGAGLGGAIFADGSTVHILNSTITGNQARGGRGGYGTYFGGPVPGGAPYDGYAGQGIGAGVYISGTLSMTNSIVAANTATVNVGADLQAAGTVGSHNLMGGNPTLGPLQDNGGPTQTIAPLAGSAAIGAGDTTTCQAAPVNDVDQRGQPRPLLGCDSGAYDTRTGPVTPTPTATQKQAPTVTSTPSSSPTAAPTWTMTPTATQTATATPTATLTPTWTATPPPTKTPTTTPTSTPAARNNGKHNGSPTSTPTATRTPVPPTASNTPVPPTATSTPTVDPTATRTPDPPTATSTSVPPTPTSTPTVDPLRSDASVAYQLDAAHTGNLAGDALTPPLYQLWAVNLGGAVSYPLVVGKLVYVTVANTGTYGTQLYALDKATGATVWGPLALGGTYNWSALTYDNGRIFALNYSGLLRAFDATNGTLAWSTQLPGQYSFTSPPTALNGIVYTGGAGSGGTVYAVRETNGALLWTAAVMNGDESSPAVTGTGVYVSYACQQDYAFAPGSGALLWHHSTYCEGGGGKTPVLAGSTLYSRDNVTGNLRLDAATGTEQGAFSSTTAPAFDGTRVYVRSGKTLNAVDPRTQATLWSFTGDGSLSSAPLVVNGCVYEASGSGHLYALDAATGAVVDTATLPAGVAAPDEQNAQSLTGLGAGGGALVVPASSWLVSYT